MMNYKRRGGTGLLIAALAHAIDPSLDLDLLARIAFCDLCAKGHQPENGVHVIMGASIPCEAFQHSVHPTAAGVESAGENSESGGG